MVDIIGSANRATNSSLIANQSVSQTTSRQNALNDVRRQSSQTNINNANDIATRSRQEFLESDLLQNDLRSFVRDLREELTRISTDAINSFDASLTDDSVINRDVTEEISQENREIDILNDAINQDAFTQEIFGQQQIEEQIESQATLFDLDIDAAIEDAAREELNRRATIFAFNSAGAPVSDNTRLGQLFDRFN